MADIKQTPEVSAIIIGFHKCGTTALYEMLRKHPHIATHESGQLPRFYLEDLVKPVSQVVEEYVKVETSDSKIIVRDTALSNEPEYLAHYVKAYPDIKVIVLVRNPVDRCLSAFNHTVSKALEFQYERIDDYIADYESGEVEHRTPPILNYIDGGMYQQKLKDVMKYISKEKMLILKAESLFKEQNKVLAEVFDFIGVDQIEMENIRANQAGSSRYRWLYRIAKLKFPGRRFLMRSIPRSIRLKIQSSLSTLSSRKRSEVKNKEPHQQRLQEIYGEDQKRLAQFCGIDYRVE